jgi:hypothetical protein
VTKKLMKVLARQTSMVTQMARLVLAKSEAPARETASPTALSNDRYKNRYHQPSGIPGLCPTRYPSKIKHSVRTSK